MVSKLPHMTDMRKEASPIMGQLGQPEYPCGLQIHLGGDELKKLDMSDDVEVGDMIHMHVMAKVTSVSASDHEAFGKSNSVGLQITHISAESEDAENKDDEEEEKEYKPSTIKERPSKLYTRA